MPNRNPLSLWIAVSIFLAAVTAVPLACRLRSRPATPPTVTELRMLAELAKVMAQDAPDLHIVPTAKVGGVEMGMYLCNDSRSWKQLSSVTRSDKEAHKWQGVVYCERISGNTTSIPDTEIQLWGKHALRVDPFLFFGDPKVLQRIDKILQNHAIPAQDLSP